MPALEHLIAFALATAIFAFVPGPAILYTAAQTLARGRRAGFMAVLGLHLGGYAHVIAAALGLSIIFRHVPELYMAVKLLGAAYLVYLGYRMIFARDEGGEPGAMPPKSARRAFIESMSVEILNPKTAMFFIAFLPQFADPAAAFPIWLQLIILGVFVNIAFSAMDIVVVMTASTAINRLKQSAKVQRWLRAAGGAVMIGLGARLALDRS